MFERKMEVNRVEKGKIERICLIFGIKELLILTV